MSKTILVFYGYKGSGKDTCYELTKQVFNCTKLAFAEPVRETVWSMFGHRLENKERLWGDLKKKEQKIEGWPIPDSIRESCGFPEPEWSGRRLMQWFGTEVGRTVTGDVWTQMMKNEIEKVIQPIICVTDCRFANEYETLKDLRKEGYKVEFIDVYRKTEDNEFGTHASEQDISEFVPDILVNNTGTIADLVKSLETNVWSLVALNEKKAIAGENT